MVKPKTDDEVKSTIRQLIEALRGGQEVESDKVDFKSLWYDLKNKKSVMEFLKDTSAIANTPGGDGYIVIGIGKKGEIVDCSFSQSGLRDESDMQDLLIKNVDTPFKIRVIEDSLEGKKFSILHIPPSNTKPHVIRNYVTYKTNKKGDEDMIDYPNEIFIRRGTSNRRPLKSELDDIYRYRHEVVSDIDLVVSANPITFFYFGDSGRSSEHNMSGTLIIENVGYRPVSIETIIIELYFPEFDQKVKIGSFTRKVFETGPLEAMVRYPIIVPSNNITSEIIGFIAVKVEFKEFGKAMREGQFEAQLEIKIASQSQPFKTKLNKLD